MLKFIFVALLLPIFITAWGALYRYRGMGPANPPKKTTFEKIVNRVKDTAVNAVFVFPVALIGWLIAAAALPFWISALVMVIMIVWATWHVTEIGHGTVYFDKYPAHAPKRDRVRNGQEVEAVYGDADYQPWYIKYFTPPLPAPWDVRWGLGITALWIVAPFIVLSLVYGHFIVAALLFGSAIAKPVAYWLGWNVIEAVYPTAVGEIGYGLGAGLTWGLAVALLIL